MTTLNKAEIFTIGAYNILRIFVHCSSFPGESQVGGFNFFIARGIIYYILIATRVSANTLLILTIPIPPVSNSTRNMWKNQLRPARYILLTAALTAALPHAPISYNT